MEKVLNLQGNKNSGQNKIMKIGLRVEKDRQEEDDRKFKRGCREGVRKFQLKFSQETKL